MSNYDWSRFVTRINVNAPKEKIVLVLGHQGRYGILVFAPERIQKRRWNFAG